ncbi:TonB-dependent receptor plug domain-containing protein [Aromatoleum aromaticum]|uniref:TonB-dependent receptor plug domain-containing protein n=1 Tax=Aromatoleum aromaticum TaxID=551760 RepID=UPI002006DFF9|nr:TonB-dependent receptor [Aromatoleum aromaticum]
MPYFEELPHVLSASRLPQPLHEAPGAVTVIDHELLTATGYRDLARVFRLVPGMQIGQERGHAQWVTYHGLSNDFPTEMQVLIDGRSVITPSAFGGVDWSALPLTLDEIDRIEIVRGTNAASFGANAFLGVINIITRHSAEGAGSGGALRVGSGGVRDAEASWTNSGGSPVSLRVNVASRRDDGFDGVHDAHHMDIATLRGDWQLSSQDSVTLRAGASAGRRGEGYTESVFGNNGPRDTRSQTTTLHLKGRHAVGDGEEWMLNYYHTHERVRDEWIASAPSYPFVPLDRNRHSVRNHLELQHRSRPAPTMQAVWGIGARRDEVDAPFLFSTGNPAAQRLYRLFGNAEWRPLARLTLNLGGAHEKYSTAPAHFSPRAFANWQATDTDTLRSGYSRAWRQHNLFERHGDIRAIDPASGELLARPFLPHRDLRQARIDTVEFGYFGRFAAWNTTLDVRLFNERIHDFVVRVPQPNLRPAPVLAGFLGSTRYENLDRPVTLRGIEYQLVARPRSGTELRLAHSLIDRDAGNRGLEARAAPYTASLSWLQDYGAGWKSMISVLRMGPLAGSEGYVPRFRYLARSYTTVDANLSYETQFGGKPLRFALSALNLGRRHQEIANGSEQMLQGRRMINAATRQVYLSVALALD